MPSKLVLVSLLVAWQLGGFAAGSAQAADAFYTRLFERGVRDLELGLAAEARQKLRTASFGFLEEPVLLAEALMQLGRAQVLTGDSEKLTETVLRLAEIEDRFKAYSGADSELKTVFESAVRSALPEALFTRLPIFEHLVTVPDLAESPPKALTRKQRKRMLERQLVADPDDGDALLALSRLYYSTGKSKSASELLDRLLTLQSDNQDARCLRADIAIDSKECTPALAGVDDCPSLIATERAAILVLDCLTTAGRSAEAPAYLDRLPSNLRQAPKVTRVTQELADPVGEDGAGQPPPPSQSPTVTQPASESEESASPEPPQAEPAETNVEETRLDPQLEERIQTLRAQIKESRFREQLEDALRQAIALGNDYPDSPRVQYLVAEIAYLAGEWQVVSDYFSRAPRPGADRPELLFYLAVATFELGNVDEAASILEEALPRLARNLFVDSYIEKILSPSLP